LRQADWNARDRFPVGLWFAAALYLFVPYIVGALVGARTTGEPFRLRRLWTSIGRPPTAWDYFFSPEPDGWVRAKLNSGGWVGGAYAEGSFASGYPERRDLLIVQAAEVDQRTGLFETDDDGKVRLREESVLIDGESVEYLEFSEG